MAKVRSHSSMDDGTITEQIARWQVVVEHKGFGKSFRAMARRKIAELEATLNQATDGGPTETEGITRR